MRKTFWFLWGVCATFCVMHYVYMVFITDNLKIINIEHWFYISLILLSATSMLNIKKGKVLLFFLCFLSLSHIYFIPEFEEITALESCNEGKCEQALKIGIVKIDNDRIIYVPRKDR
ncbi:MAG: hypothetical protein IJ532_05495 [Alphaproteobacteria bacterium]|nr:hypothetical protein [Alphaproteobacteria bacterium]